MVPKPAAKEWHTLLQLRRRRRRRKKERTLCALVIMQPVVRQNERNGWGAVKRGWVCGGGGVRACVYSSQCENARERKSWMDGGGGERERELAEDGLLTTGASHLPCLLRLPSIVSYSRVHTCMHPWGHLYVISVLGLLDNNRPHLSPCLSVFCIQPRSCGKTHLTAFRPHLNDAMFADLIGHIFEADGCCSSVDPGEWLSLKVPYCARSLFFIRLQWSNFA